MSKRVQTFCNLLVLGALGLVLLIFDQVLDPVKSGYFKNDQSIAYSYKPSSIPSLYVHGVGLIVPFFLIFLYHFLEQKNIPFSNRFDFAIDAIPTIFGYLFGIAMSELLTVICKYNVGRLRPHFFSLCKPTILNETEVDPDTQYVSFDNYNCSGSASTSANRIREVYLSFPSGHTSYAFQTAVFLILYLQAKFSGRDGVALLKSLFIPMTQILILVAAVYTGISRIQDHKHHPTDVIAGALIGSFAQIMNVVGVTKIFEKDEDINIPKGEEMPMENLEKKLEEQNTTISLA